MTNTALEKNMNEDDIKDASVPMAILNRIVQLKISDVNLVISTLYPCSNCGNKTKILRKERESNSRS
jgi:hypothetical protein